MALPIISNNTPVVGSISWTTFGIEWGGVGYTVAAGSTSNAFVYWHYNGGSPQIIQTNTLPATLAAEDYFLFLNKGGIGAFVDTTQVTDGSMIVTGSILAAAIGANQINAGHIQSDSIGTDELAAGAVYADNVAAGAITTDKLGVGTVSDSLVTNGSFEEYLSGVPIGWVTGVSGNGTVDIITGIASSGTNAARLLANDTTPILQIRQSADKLIPVSSTAGRKWYVSTRAGTGTAGVTRGFYVRALWYNAAKSYLSYTDVITPNQAIPTTFDVFEGQVTPPSTARYMGLEVTLSLPNVACSLYVDEIVAREVQVAASISDGAITTPKLSAGAVTADKILVSDRTNHWENPDFEDDVVGITPRGVMLNQGTCRTVAVGANGSGKSMELDAFNGTHNVVLGLDIIPVKPGDKWYLNYDYKFLNTTGAGAAGIGFRPYGPTRNVLTDVIATTAGAKSTSWANNNGAVYTVPAGTYYIQPLVTFQNNAETTNRFHVDNIVMRRMNGGELLVDGAIEGQTITGVGIKTGPDAQTGVYAQMGQYMVSNVAGSGDRPGFGFVDPNSTSPKIGMFSEDARTLILMGDRGIINGPAESYVTLNKDESWLYNNKDVNIYTSSWSGSSIDINSGGLVSITSTSGPVKLNGNEAQGVSPWQTVTLINSWVAYTGGGNYFNGLRCRKEGHNVRYQGMVKSGALGTVICNLPSGYVPRATSFHTIMTSNAGTSRQLGAVIFSVSTPGVSGTLSYDTGLATPTWINIDVAIPLHDG